MKSLLTASIVHAEFQRLLHMRGASEQTVRTEVGRDCLLVSVGDRQRAVYLVPDATSLSLAMFSCRYLQPLAAELGTPAGHDQAEWV